MRTSDGNKIRCWSAGKICYTEREAGAVINNARRHHYGNDDKRGKHIPKCKFYASCREMA